jgi:hypothetical protein
MSVTDGEHVLILTDRSTLEVGRAIMKTMVKSRVTLFYSRRNSGSTNMGTFGCIRLARFNLD